MALLQGIYELSRRKPGLARKLARKGAVAFLKDETYVDTHFKPRYDPWDQRLCLVPDGDLFKAIREGKASVVTDTIDRFVPEGIKLTSGEVLEADIIISATGLTLRRFGDLAVDLDGVEVDLADTVAYRAMMVSGVPNFGFCFGYSNNSWTLRADLSARYLCRLLAHMDAHGYDVATPTLPAKVTRKPFLDLSSGYVTRGIAKFPKAGDRGAWEVSQNHLKMALKFKRNDLDEDMTFAKVSQPAVPVR
jgi:cation diffusion facilitator CzcD-associated flavoprotein CzcO